jgi:RHS repeat-associated protein
LEDDAGVGYSYDAICCKFTGKERDSESGLDNVGARYDASSLGRFMTPDPVHILKQKLVDPQQWNMYAYVRNNPLRFVDPKGKWIELTGSDEERKKQLQALHTATHKPFRLRLLVKFSAAELEMFVFRENVDL